MEWAVGGGDEISRECWIRCGEAYVQLISEILDLPDTDVDVEAAWESSYHNHTLGLVRHGVRVH